MDGRLRSAQRRGDQAAEALARVRMGELVPGLVVVLERRRGAPKHAAGTWQLLHPRQRAETLYFTLRRVAPDGRRLLPALPRNTLQEVSEPDLRRLVVSMASPLALEDPDLATLASIEAARLPEDQARDGPAWDLRGRSPEAVASALRATLKRMGIVGVRVEPLSEWGLRLSFTPQAHPCPARDCALCARIARAGSLLRDLVLAAHPHGRLLPWGPSQAGRVTLQTSELVLGVVVGRTWRITGWHQGQLAVSYTLRRLRADGKRLQPRSAQHERRIELTGLTRWQVESLGRRQAPR